jgi:hypothetical protein
MSFSKQNLANIKRRMTVYDIPNYNPIQLAKTIVANHESDAEYYLSIDTDSEELLKMANVIAYYSAEHLVSKDKIPEYLMSILGGLKIDTQDNVILCANSIKINPAFLSIFMSYLLIISTQEETD